MSAGSEKLEFLLRLQEELGGSIPFDRWMSEALYHPQFGYYTVNVRGIGRTGDFTTWPVVHQSLGRALAHWALSGNRSRRWHLIEVGAGSGDLAVSVLRAIGWWRRPHYHIVEVSPVLREAQRQKLGRKVTWHASMRDAMAACDGQAVIFSNELVDAFPCRIFQLQGGVWRELFLRIEGGKVIEVFRETDLPASTVFERSWPEGQRVEVQPSYHDWLRDWQPLWHSGAMATIDYGDRCSELYHRRMRGSLRAYSHHQRLEGSDAYAGFGLRDLTVDVNFSDLEKWSPRSGFFTLGAFLERNAQPVAAHLGEAATAFKVHLQAR